MNGDVLRLLPAGLLVQGGRYAVSTRLIDMVAGDQRPRHRSYPGPFHLDRRGHALRVERPRAWANGVIR